MENLQKIFFSIKASFGPQQDPNELQDLIEFLLTKNIKTVLEIGTGFGGSAFIFLRYFDFVVSIDKYKHIRSGYFHLLDPARFVFIQEKSADAKESAEKYLAGRAVNLLFIDGSHEYNDVKHDFNLYKDLVGPGGYIVFHDIVCSEYTKKHRCTIYEFWKEIKSSYPFVKEIIKNGKWGGFGVIGI